MSVLDRLNPQRRRLESLLSEHRFRDALTLATEANEEARAQLEQQVCQLAATHWLSQAERGCFDGDRSRMNAALAEAARFHRDSLGAVFRESRWRIRQFTLELTMASHWTVLLQAAAEQRALLLAGDGSVPASWSAFVNPHLTRELASLHAGTPEELDRIDSDTLASLRRPLAEAYPTELRPAVHEAPVDFVRAALWVALARPDLAVLPLLELEETNPLVCLERARVAFALGFPATTTLALGDFAAHHGRHVTVRRLNTGVFMAQMAQASGDPERAADILAALPLDEVGRRPNLLYAQLLTGLGDHDRARQVLDGWIAGHPEDQEAQDIRSTLDR